MRIMSSKVFEPLTAKKSTKNMLRRLRPGVDAENSINRNEEAHEELHSGTKLSKNNPGFVVLRTLYCELLEELLRTKGIDCDLNNS